MELKMYLNISIFKIYSVHLNYTLMYRSKGVTIMFMDKTDVLENHFNYVLFGEKRCCKNKKLEYFSQLFLLSQLIYVVPNIYEFLSPHLTKMKKVSMISKHFIQCSQIL